MEIGPIYKSNVVTSLFLSEAVPDGRSLAVTSKAYMVAVYDCVVQAVVWSIVQLRARIMMRCNEALIVELQVLVYISILGK